MRCGFVTIGMLILNVPSNSTTAIFCSHPQRFLWNLPNLVHGRPAFDLLSTNAATQSTDLNQLALQITADPEHGHRSIS